MSTSPSQNSDSSSLALIWVDRSHSPGGWEAKAGAAEITPAKPRLRRWTPKTRTGCLTCRKRRVKCDEIRPYCRRCHESERHCLGYTTRDEGVFLNSDQPWFSPSPPEVSLTVQDAQLFDFLQGWTVKQVAGGYNEEFWSSDLLRAMKASPPIWHAGLALAAMYRRDTLKEKKKIKAAKEYHVFALGQYTRAISHVIAIVRTPRSIYTNAEQQILLLTSILLASICYLDSNVQQADIHLKYLLTLFYEWRFWAKSSSVPGIFCNKSLISIVTYYEAEFEDYQMWRRISKKRWIEMPPIQSMALESITDIYNQVMYTSRLQLCTLSPSFALLAGESWPNHERLAHIQNNLDFLRKNVHEIRTTLKHKSTHQKHVSDGDKLTVVELLIEYLGISSTIMCLSRQNAADWIESYSEFGPVLDRAAELLENNLLPSGCAMSSGLVDVVGGIALCCKRSDLRRRAIALLRKCHGWDKGWNPKMGAAYLEQCTLLEESGRYTTELECCKCVPNLYVCRDHSEGFRDIVILEDGLGFMTWCNRYEAEHGLPKRTVPLSW